MAHTFNVYRTPAALRRSPVPVPVHLLADAPAARPAEWKPLTWEQLEAEVDLAFARIISE